MVHVFDWNTRAVYDETTSAPVGTMALRWASEARGKSKKKLTKTNRGIGASGLQAMSLRACILNLDLITVETLQSVQWYYAGQIYKECQNRQALSYNDWFLFSKAFPDEINRYQHFSFYRSNNENDLVVRELPHICGKLAKLSTDHLSLLLLIQVDISFEHLINLNKISNLSGLCLVQKRGAYPLRDHQQHIKHWARHARDHRALGRLEVLYMANFSVEMPEILDAGSLFPSLHLVGLARCAGVATSPSSFGTGSATWRRYCIDSSETKYNICPSEIWDSSHPATSDQAKIRKILSFSRNLRNDTELPEPSVSITYGDPSSPARSHMTSNWFVRSRPTSQEEESKRGPVEDLNKKSLNAKKRKTIRAGKQADVTSLLGQFS